MQIAAVKTSVILDEQLVNEVGKTVTLVGENQATILRMAIRAGLPVVANRSSARPEGYFKSAYRRRDAERETLEEAMLKIPQKSER